MTGPAEPLPDMDTPEYRLECAQAAYNRANTRLADAHEDVRNAGWYLNECRKAVAGRG